MKTYSSVENKKLKIVHKRLFSSEKKPTAIFTLNAVKRNSNKKPVVALPQIESSKKTNNIAFPRQVAMYLMRDMTDMSLPKIGEYFGGRHYTTVMYACEKIEDEIKRDPSFDNLIRELKEKIKD